MNSALTLNGPRLQMLVLDRTDPRQNMARFYVLSLEPTLFGDTALVREWGRWGQSGRRRLDLYPDVAEAVEALEDWLVRKTKRGYRVVDGEAEAEDRSKWA
ncbi:MAG: WGR domain-containing protein [Bosea sp. (in: a-proteobacteria)]|uniref:WGR domain-containing protein n=1 Tax=Bosea sp. (in: a-proteobacteria) TaxID=1871050 RepID=UPI003F7C5FA4